MLNDYVHLSRKEIISGEKTFTQIPNVNGNIILTSADKNIIYKWCKDEPDFGVGASKGFNTVYTAEQDGWLLFNTHIKTSANYITPQSALQIYGSVGGQVVFGHLLATNWDNSSNTVQNDTMNTLLVRVYKGQQYKLYQDYARGSANILSYNLIFFPLKI